MKKLAQIDASVIWWFAVVCLLTMAFVLGMCWQSYRQRAQEKERIEQGLPFK